MTNGQGKSDSPVVPEKSPNKAGQPVMEGMEGRGLAKGNLPQQNASRTPSRERLRLVPCYRPCSVQHRFYFNKLGTVADLKLSACCPSANICQRRAVVGASSPIAVPSCKSVVLE
jgi:hypothetical protein